MAASGAAAFAFIYLGLLAGFLLALRRDQSAWAILGVLLIIKSCDIGAYFTGRAIGRHKLIPWLSPGKTWEGLLGGAALSAAVGVGVAWVARSLELPEHARPLAFSQMSFGLAALIGVAFGLVGQAGDLFESVLKRDAGMKDSGRSLPGFGGVLDVADSVLLVAPIAYWVLSRV
jgi:phosphatidate cytidylyltransferase